MRKASSSGVISSQQSERSPSARRESVYWCCAESGSEPSMAGFDTIGMLSFFASETAMSKTAKMENVFDNFSLILKFSYNIIETKFNLREEK